jgi:AhpD family alkylhydroperoxidase
MHAHETLHDVAAEGRILRDSIPDVYTAYAGLSQAAMREGVLTVKVKELIALAISVTRECDGCIASHARSAVRAGCTSEEVAEAMGVAILLNGGPGTVWGPRAFAAFREWAEHPETA